MAEVLACTKFIADIRRSYVAEVNRRSREDTVHRNINDFM